MKRQALDIVECNMTTQLDTPLTIKEYANQHGVAERTVRRRIKAGVLSARMESGRYVIYGQNGLPSGEEASRQNGKGARQFGKPDVQSNGHEPHTGVPESDAQKVLIDHLTTENAFLRDQLAKQTSLLAASTAQNAEAMKQLNPPPKPTLSEKIRGIYDRVRKKTPDAQPETKTP